MLSPYADGLITFGVVYTLMAAAIHIPLLANYLLLSQVGFMLIASYSSAALVLAGWPWILAAPVGVLASIVAAALVGLLGLRVKDFPLAIASIAISEALRLTIMSTGILGGISGLSGIPKAANAQVSVLILAAVMLGLAWFHQTRTCRAVIALGDDEISARAFGHNPVRLKLLVGVLSGLLCGCAGVLYAAYVRFLDPNFFGFSTLIFILVFVVVGGARRMFGPLLGVALLWVLPGYLSFLADYRLVAYSAVVLLILMIDPGGLSALAEKAARKIFAAARPLGRGTTNRSIQIRSQGGVNDKASAHDQPA